MPRPTRANRADRSQAGSHLLKIPPQDALAGSLFDRLFLLRWPLKGYPFISSLLSVFSPHLPPSSLLNPPLVHHVPLYSTLWF